MRALAQIDFDGRFHPDLLESAVTKALERHPMLRSTVSGRRAWREPLPANQAAPVRWLPWSNEIPAQAFERMDVSREIGIRVLVQQNAECARMTLAAHHAAADAAGLARFFWDIAAAYAAVSTGPGTEPRWGPSDPELLERRGEPRRTQPAAAAWQPQPSATPPLSEIAGFLLRRPVRVRASRGAGEQVAPPVVAHTFEAPEFDRIRRYARVHDAAVNDVFLCALFQTLAEWNAPGAPYRGGRWLRVMVPTDLRTRGDVGIGAANVMGYAFIDRRARDCKNSAALLAGIGDEMRSVRHTRAGHRILDGIALVDRVPGLLNLLLRPHVTLATAVFSNIGRVSTRLPDGAGRGPDALGERIPTLREVRAVVSLRPGTRAGFGLSRLRNTLTLTLRTDPRYLDGEAAEALLAAFAGRVNDTCRHDSIS
ncbi:MAG: hypothetical protein ACYCVL_00570 [Gemmatimonadaceae bacterium]